MIEAMDRSLYGRTRTATGKAAARAAGALLLRLRLRRAFRINLFLARGGIGLHPLHHLRRQGVLRPFALRQLWA
jgi:hypothetical protein